ncbi:MAG: TMEM165/GDT1 family protein [Planctomycetota bacterium]
MDWKLLATVFGSVFIAELGDKTQLATMLFASRSDAARWQVFVAAAGALVLSTALGVLAGSALTQWIGERTLRWIAGCAFLVIGGVTLWRA